MEKDYMNKMSGWEPLQFIFLFVYTYQADAVMQRDFVQVKI